MENLLKGKHESEPQVGLCVCVLRRERGVKCVIAVGLRRSTRSLRVDSHMVFIVSFTCDCDRACLLLRGGTLLSLKGGCVLCCFSSFQWSLAVL